MFFPPQITNSLATTSLEDENKWCKVTDCATPECCAGTFFFNHQKRNLVQDKCDFRQSVQIIEVAKLEDPVTGGLWQNTSSQVS